MLHSTSDSASSRKPARKRLSASPPARSSPPTDRPVGRPLRAALRSLVPLAFSVLAASCSADAHGDAPATFPTEALAVVNSEQGGLRAEIRTSPEQPPQRGVVTAEYTITDAQGAPVDGLDINASLWMPAMGHGASVNPTIEPLGQGRYLARNVSLFMAGKWELRTRFSGPVTDTATLSFDVP
jgi:hypothetical protein